MKSSIAAALAAALLLGCARDRPQEPLVATAALQPTTGSKAFGEATFEQEGSGVHVLVNAQGLKPGQEHGFHIHEAGDCSSGDGMSTKGHFNPMGKPHAHPGSGHAGDLPALQADASGNAKVDVMATGITVSPGPTSVVGRGLIVHADPDDYKTQPTGNAGARIACAVIRLQ
jgi:Cu-Zn family superoxide dismutase